MKDIVASTHVKQILATEADLKLTLLRDLLDEPLEETVESAREDPMF